MALLQLGQSTPAQQAFLAAAELDPALDAESASGQAARALCAGQRRGRRAAVQARGPPGAVRPSPAALDESHGRATTTAPDRAPRHAG